MEMHQVRYFLAVAETLNFTRAAEQCHVAQPSLTKAIQKLEDELGGPLFRRERSLTHLTDLGRLMKPHLEQVLAASETARTEAKSYKKRDKAPLRLGVMCTIGPHRMVDFIHRLKDELPSVELTVHDASGKKLVDEMMQGELDVALIGLPKIPERFDARVLYGERYVVAFPRGHRFEKMNAVPIRELDGENYLQRVNCEFGEFFDDLGIPYPASLKIRYRSEREDWIQALILAGQGCSTVPEYLPVLPGIATRVLIEPEVSREIKLVTVAGRRYSPPVETLIRLARRYDWAGRS